MAAPRLLSSRQTFFLKFVFPPLWIGSFGAATAFLWWATGPSKGPPVAMKWLFLAMWVGGSALVWWSCVHLKRVRVDEAFLYVSNYATEVRIPLAALVRVRENRWMNPRPVTLEFRTPTPFGRRIVFVPKARLLGWGSPHPVVAELRDSSARAGGGDGSAAG